MILVLNGPNLNLLGKREPRLYGRTSLADLNELCSRWARELKTEARCRQSNHEGEIIEWLHGAAAEGAGGVVLNPGGYSHTSVAIRDAISAVELPVIEVHLSNIFAREAFRHVSLISAVCRGSIAGLGPLSYKAALTAMVALLAEE
ncbi:MAG TPA: type II 3-dehydroquinate dehydratase [Trueperaceae bacterium]